jgi:hypothetical protein
MTVTSWYAEEFRTLQLRWHGVRCTIVSRRIVEQASATRLERRFDSRRIAWGIVLGGRSGVQWVPLLDESCTTIAFDVVDDGIQVPPLVGRHRFCLSEPSFSRPVGGY